MALSLPTDGTILDLATTSAHSTWLLGEVLTGTGVKQRESTLTMHWNGKGWKTVPAPSPGVSTLPTSISAAGSRVFVSGIASSKSAQSATFILRFTGGKWHKESAPSPGKTSELHSISVSSKSGAAVGEWSVHGICTAHSSPFLALTLNLTGSSWRQESVAKFRTAIAHRRRLAAAPAVGSC
jgi:hypothetical protein